MVHVKQETTWSKQTQQWSLDRLECVTEQFPDSHFLEGCFPVIV